MDERLSGLHVVEELFVLPLERRVVQNIDLDAGLAQYPYATTLHPGIRVHVADDHARDAGPQDGLDAGRRPAVMVAGFQRHVERGPTRSPSGLTKGHYLGVVLSCPGMPALAKHATVARHDGPNEGVRRNRVTPALGEATGKIHHRILQHVFLSPIRTLTVGAGLRLAPNTNLHRLNLQGGWRAPRQGRETTLQGSPPVREFHPPPKVSQQPIPQKDQGSKECPRTSTYSYAPGACRIFY